MNNSLLRIFVLFFVLLCVLSFYFWIDDYRFRLISRAENTFTSKQADPVENKDTEAATGYTAKIEPAVIVKGTIRSG
ncbi:MAG: hypothetical protein JRI35_07015, partial [Deltaproteobacteria bacterium]|nr:hypothetical protein [Deltaproteobacteria bacterium]